MNTITVYHDESATLMIWVNVAADA